MIIKTLVFQLQCNNYMGLPWADPEGRTVGSKPRMENHKLLLCFFINNGTNTLQEAIGPTRSNCFSREVRTALCEIR